MAATIEALEIRLVPTTISLLGDGNLLIDTFDNSVLDRDQLEIRADVGNAKFIISDPTQILITSISGSTTSPDQHVVEVPFSSAPLAKRVIVNTLAGDDFINVSAIGGNFGFSPVINAGAGFDEINVIAVVLVATPNEDLLLSAENIRLGGDLTISGGKITLDGNVLLTNNVNLTSVGAASGQVQVNGQLDSALGPSVYTLITTPRTYDDARAQAGVDAAGGYLVTIRSAAEQALVKSVALNNDVWIGASDGLNEGEWKWDGGPDSGLQFWNGDGTTGGPVNGEYSNWFPGEPDDLPFPGDAAILTGNDTIGGSADPGGWSDGDTSVQRPYIVESPSGFSLTVNSGTANFQMNGPIGNFGPLRFLNVTANQSSLFGGSVSTFKSQTYNSTVVLGGPSLLRAEEIDFNGGVGSVSGSSANLTLAPIKLDAPITVGSATDSGPASFDITDTDIAALAVGFAGILIGEPPFNGGGSVGSLQSIGPVTVTSSTFLSPVLIAGGSISVTALNAGSNRVELIATIGSITDGGNTATDITGGNLSLDSVTGVGASNDSLELAVVAVSARGLDSGGVFLSNTGNLAIGSPQSPGGLFTNGEPISVTSTGSITVVQGITSRGGDVSLTAANGITIDGVPVDTAQFDGSGGDFTADADSDNNGTGTFSILSVTDFVDWISTTQGLFADGSTVDVSTTTLADATPQINPSDTRFSDPSVYLPAQAVGDFLETRFSLAREAVFFTFSIPQNGLFLHFDGMQVQGLPFNPATENPINLYSFDRNPFKASGDPTWQVDGGTNSVQQLTGDHVADQDGTLSFLEPVSSLTMTREAPGVDPGAGGENVVNLQLGLFRAGGLLTGGGDVSIRAADVNLQGFISANTGLVTFLPSQTNRPINLGTQTAGSLSLTAAELDQIATSELQVGDASSGAITISGSITRPEVTNITLTTGGNNSINFSGSNGSLNASGGSVTLSLNPSGTGGITSGGAPQDIGGLNVVLLSGSGGIGASGNALITDATNLVAATNGNASAFLREINDVTIAAVGLSAGTGAITLTGGAFLLGGSNRIDDSSRLSLQSGATFHLNGSDEALASLQGSGSVANGSTTAATLSVNLASDATFSGVLGGPGTDQNNFSLSKSGSATLTLSGTSTFTGTTTINGGTLLINGSTVSATTVASGATLGGSGTINAAVTINSGGSIAPGNSTGILNTGNVAFTAGPPPAIFAVEVNGVTPGSGHDQLNVTGTVNLGGATLSATGSITPLPGQAVVLINNDGTDAVTGTFGSLPQGALLLIGGQPFHIAYNHNSGDGNSNDVAVIANRIPIVNNQSFSINENNNNGAAVGTVAASDADSAVTFAITGGNTGSVFAINLNSGAITVSDATGLNFESNPSFSLTVEVTDDAGATDTATISIDVTNTPPAVPTDGNGAANTVSEGASTGDPVGIDADSGDPNGGAITFSLPGNAGGRFTINSSTGVVTVGNASLLNFESAASHTITVGASDGTATSTQSFTISVTNVAPSVPVDGDTAANSVSEAAVNGDLVGIDADSSDVHGGAVTFSLTNDAGGRFAINAGTGVVRVADASLLDFESETTHSITVQASDGTDVATQTFTIAVTNVGPSTPFDVDSAPNQVSEGVNDGDLVGLDVNSSDPHGGGINFTLTNDAGGRFTIHADTGVVTVADVTLLDFTASDNHTITVEVTDGRDVATQSFTIQVAGAAPTAPVDLDTQTNSVPEGALEGSRVRITLFSEDAQLENVFYRLTDNAGGRFAIDPITGVVTVKEGRLLKFADASRHSITATAVDATGHVSQAATFNITVSPVAADALPLASILPTRVSLVEGDSGPNFITFLVKLNKPSAETITIDFSTRLGDDPTFVRPEGIPADAPFATDQPGLWDFFRSTGKLTFDPGVTEQPLRVQLRPDDTPEPNELFFVQLQSPVNVTLAPQQSVAVARILDDDSVPQLIFANTQVLEGDSAGQNEMVFTVQLIGDLPPGTASVTADYFIGNIAIDTAIAGVDYGTAFESERGGLTPTSTNQLIFTNELRTREVHLPILGDLDDEADKSVSLRLENHDAPETLGISRREAVGMIINDDSTTDVLVTISPAVYKIRENNSGSQQLEFFVTLIGKPSDAVSVNYATSDATATAGSDYTAASGTIEFTLAEIAAGSVQKSVLVTVSGDTTIEPDETFTISVSLPAGTPAEVSVDPDLTTGRVVIRNDDQAILTEDGDALALALSNELTALLGAGPKNNPALLAALRARALDIIRIQGLTKAIVIIIDPVDFVLTDAQNRQSGYTEGTGVVNAIPGTYYSGDGTVELMIVPLPPDGTYNVQLAGLGGDFNASITVLDSNGTSTSIISQSLSDGANSSVSFQVGSTTIPVGLGLAAANSGAASAIGVVGAFGHAEFRLALAAALEDAASEGFNLNDSDSQPTGLLYWLSVSARVARQQFLDPLLQSLGNPLGDLLTDGLAVSRGIPAEFVDQFWSHVGQTLTGVPAGIYRLGDMLESLLPTLVPRRNRVAPPRAGDQGQPRTPPASGTKIKRSALERPRVTPPTPSTGNRPATQQTRPNATNDKSAQAPELKKVVNQQTSTTETRWLWFTFKDDKPAERRRA